MKKVILLGLAFFFAWSVPVLAAPKFFGYLDGYGKPLGISQYGSYVNMVLDTQRVGNDPAVVASAYISDINQLSPLGVKPIIAVDSIFFYWVNGGARLSPDYQTRWNEFWQNISPYRSKILGSYPLDEPDAWTSCSEFSAATDAIRSSVGTDPAAPAILELLDATAVDTWAKYPNPPRQGWLNSSGDFCIPSSVNWLAMDHYCWGSGCNVESELTWLNTLAVYRPIVRNFSGQTGIFVVPQAYTNSIPVSANTQQVLITANQGYYNLCKSLSQCVGVLPFLWTQNPDGSNLYGVSSMPVLESYLKTEATAIIGTKTVPIPGDLNGDGRVDILDLRQLLANFASIFDYNLVVGNFGK